MNVATLSLIVSFISLYVATRIAWETIFSPPKLVALLSQILIFSKFGDEECTEVMRGIIPSLIIRNIGAKIAIIEKVRLVITPNESRLSQILLYPESIVNVDKMMNDKIKYSESGKDGFPINIDEMFSGFSITSGESWNKSYSYTVPKDQLEKVSDKTRIFIEVKERKKGWVRIHSAYVNFNDSFTSSPGREGFKMFICRSEDYAD